MLRFILTHPRVLSFGLLLTLFSSFGQTFLISIFVPRILTSFGLSVSALGYPLGEGLLPLAVVLMIHGLGWRVSWLLLGALMLFVFVPATQSLLRNNPMTGSMRDKPRRHSGGRRHFLADPRFYLLLPANLAMPLILTALFLYQLQLAD